MTNTLQNKMILFIGMSIPHDLIPNRSEFEIHPPVKRGDLGKLKLSRGDKVIVIDGEFGQNLAVSPKEILILLENGIQVYGQMLSGNQLLKVIIVV